MAPVRPPATALWLCKSQLIHQSIAHSRSLCLCNVRNLLLWPWKLTLTGHISCSGFHFVLGLPSWFSDGFTCPVTLLECFPVSMCACAATAEMAPVSSQCASPHYFHVLGLCVIFAHLLTHLLTHTVRTGWNRDCRFCYIMWRFTLGHRQLTWRRLH